MVGGRGGGLHAGRIERGSDAQMMNALGRVGKRRLDPEGWLLASTFTVGARVRARARA